MKYELAKQLKEAGFQQYGNNRAVDGGKIMIGHQDYTAEYYVPTLEELIDACGDEMMSLHKTANPHGFDNWTWCAESYFDDASTNGKGTRLGVAKNPSEAVAKLWLALNRK